MSVRLLNAPTKSILPGRTLTSPIDERSARRRSYKAGALNLHAAPTI